jgi:Plasmid pRiA4b ORF-3-like protein
MLEKTRPTIHQLNVSLVGSNPLIWRRIEVPSEMTLPQLHRTLQIVMGWENCHLHEFKIAGKIYAPPDPEDDHFGRDVLDERRAR